MKRKKLTNDKNQRILIICLKIIFLTSTPKIKLKLNKIFFNFNFQGPKN